MDFDSMLSLDDAYQQVLAHPLFSHYTREDLSSCKTFCDIIRQAPAEEIRKLHEALELIAYETDDHNEAGGFLLSFVTLAGGFNAGVFNNVPAQATEMFDSIPVDNAEKFADWVISIPTAQRENALAAARNAALMRIVRLKEDDYSARLHHHHVCTLMYYALENIDNLLTFGNYANESLPGHFNINDLIHPRLWEAFQSRPAAEIKRLIEKWWGEKSKLPHDFFIALEWQREGRINIHKSKGYGEAVAEFVLASCEPEDTNFHQHARAAYGIEAIQRHPFLAQDLYDALSIKPLFRWLVSDNQKYRAAYLECLFEAGALDRNKILSALEVAITQDRNKQYVTRYKQLKQLISP